MMIRHTWFPTTVVALTALTSLSLGASPEQVRGFFTAVQAGDAAVVADMLEDSPELVAARDDQGATPLHRTPNAAVAQALVDAGADVAAKDSSDNASPLRWAAAERRSDVVKVLQAAGAREDDIFFAVAVGDAARVTEMLKADPSLARRRTDPGDAFIGQSPASALHVAAYYGRADIARVLLVAGADVHDRGGWGETEALEKACFAGHADVIRVLLEAGADIEYPPNDVSRQPLHNAALPGHLACVQILIDAGARVHPETVAQAEQRLGDARRDAQRNPADPAAQERIRNLEAVVDLLKQHVK